MTAPSAFRFTHRFRVRYAEIDGQNIVFNAHYLTYYDTAITEYLRHIGHDYEKAKRETGNDFHLVRSVVEYKAPIRYDEEIDVAVRASRIGRSSLVFELAIFGVADGTLRATGENTWVNTNQTTHRTEPVSDAMIELIRSHEGHALALARTA